jgi:hypothetical protein
MGTFFGRSQLDKLFFEAHDLEVAELEVKRWVASVPMGIFSKHGGNLVLTNKRLLFEPLKTPGWTPISKYLAPFAEHQGSADLANLASAEAVPGSSPKLRVLSQSGQAREFLIFVRRLSLIWSSANAAARNEAVSTINAAIQTARAAQAA